MSTLATVSTYFCLNKMRFIVNKRKLCSRLASVVTMKHSPHMVYDYAKHIK